MALKSRKKTSADKDQRLTLRISGKDKFAFELLARKEGLSLSALFKKILDESLKKGLTLPRSDNSKEQVYIPDIAYDPLVPDRLVKLAQASPDLLTDREQVIWKVIQENPAYWSNNSPDFSSIRNRWSSIQSDSEAMLDQFSKMEWRYTNANNLD